MSYFIRAFCLDDKLPSTEHLSQWIASKGIHARISDVEGGSGIWTRFLLYYGQDRRPIEVSCLRGTSKDEEVEEFVHELDEMPDTAAVRKVLAHLRQTQIVVGCDLPTADIDDSGWAANDAILDWFVQHSRAMLQADGEGFYEGTTLVVALE